MLFEKENETALVPRAAACITLQKFVFISFTETHIAYQKTEFKLFAV